MNNTIDKLNSTYQEKNKSGWVKIFIAIALLVIAIPLLVFGLGQATYNGVKYITPHNRNVRKLKKLKIKKEKQEVKLELNNIKKGE